MKYIKLYLLLQFWDIYLTLKTDWYYIKGKTVFAFFKLITPIGISCVGAERYLMYVAGVANKFQHNLHLHKEHTLEKTTELSKRVEELARNSS